MSVKVDKIIAVINKDATGRWRLLDSNGRQCVMGGLLSACGEAPNGWPGLSGDSSTVALAKHYGLSPSHIGELMLVNDWYDNSQLDERRAALADKVRSFA